MKTIAVAAAMIRDGDRIFATQRGYGDWKDFWEFPGGKIEPGEGPEEALVREIREELGARIAVDAYLTTIEYDYPAFHLSMGCYLAHVTEGELTLKEHEAARWLSRDELDDVAWLPADRTIIELLKRTLPTVEAKERERPMKSLLIKDTTREERERIVADSVGNIDGLCDGCGPGLLNMYQDYIEGRKELREINMEFRRNYVSGAMGPDKSGCEFSE